MSTLSSDSLKELTRLANALIEADEKVEKAEEDLKKAKEDSRKLREDDIPEFLVELELTSIKLESGETIGYKQDVRIETNAEDKEKAYSWLEEHEFGGLIKTTVTAAFGKGELAIAKLLLIKLTEEMNLTSVSLKRDVHYQTMCAFLREQIEVGNEIPLELFGATPIKKATIKFPPKPRKIGGAA